MKFDIDGLREVDITNPNGYYWKDYTLSNMANGTCLTMTPLDILSFYNTIANGGQMVRPCLVKAIGRGNDTFTPHGHVPDTIRKNVLSKAVTDSLTSALTGNGRWNALKTGTAYQIIRPYYENGQEQNPYEDSEGRYQSAATCAGFFPADNPQYSIICTLFSYPCQRTYDGNGLPTAVVTNIIDNIAAAPC